MGEFLFTILHHLKELPNAGLITTERRGKFLIAKINKEVLEEACSIIKLQKNSKHCVIFVE